MTASTHYDFSYLLCAAAGLGPPTGLIASLFALLPDIDHPESTIGRLFSPVSKSIQRKYGHRTITHSVFAILAMSIFLLPFFILAPSGGAGALGFAWQGFYFAALLAFSSRIFIDLFNKSGVRLFAPCSQKEYISGTIDVKNYFPEIKSNNFLIVDRRTDGATFTLKCARSLGNLPHPESTQ